MQQAIKDKKAAYKIWQRSGQQEDRETYGVKRNEARRAVARAKQNAIEVWCENLDTAECRRKMFVMAKQMRKDKKDIIGGYFVKVENGEILTTDAEIRERWKLYLDGLLNEWNENEIEHVEPVEGPILDVTDE